MQIQIKKVKRDQILRVSNEGNNNSSLEENALREQEGTDRSNKNASNDIENEGGSNTEGISDNKSDESNNNTEPNENGSNEGKKVISNIAALSQDHISNSKIQKQNLSTSTSSTKSESNFTLNKNKNKSDESNSNTGPNENESNGGEKVIDNIGELVNDHLRNPKLQKLNSSDSTSSTQSERNLNLNMNKNKNIEELKKKIDIKFAAKNKESKNQESKKGGSLTDSSGEEEFKDKYDNTKNYNLKQKELEELIIEK